MGRFSLMFLVGMAAVGSWLFFRDVPLDPGRWPEVTLQQPGEYPVATTTPAALRNPIKTGRKVRMPKLLPKDPRYLRIATFNIGMLKRSKAEDAQIIDRLAMILAQFDVVALQDIAPPYAHVVGTLTDVINAAGEDYGYVLGPPVGRDDAEQRLAFVYDKKRVEIDEFELYTVSDPDDLLQWEPLVGWFRVRQVAPEDAFTFTLINCRTDPRERERENAILGGIIREVANDQRGEDDVILAGDFSASAEKLEEIAGLADPLWAVTELATDTEATGQFDNLVCNRQFTDEATGRSGVFDFLRQMNLSVAEAAEISGHLPVWSEFMMVEGGRKRSREFPNQGGAMRQTPKRR